jgi:acetyltransferase-like isoleucine patch superfamily enzyme
MNKICFYAKYIAKGVRRLFRILTLKKGIYCEYGKKNKFVKPVLLFEDAKIGKYNYIGPTTMINNAIIGNYCSIAPGVKIGQGNHCIGCITTYQRIAHKVYNHNLKTLPSIISSDVWICADSIIAQGVRIGQGAIIGANSFVNSDIPPYAIAVGSPARVISFRFDSQKIDHLIKSEWVDQDIKKAIKTITRLENNTKCHLD